MKIINQSQCLKMKLWDRSIDIDETSSINVLDMPVSEWCTCENCQIMDTAEECICCAGCEYVHPNIEDNTCITEHSLFELIVCNPDVLAVAFILKNDASKEGSSSRAVSTAFLIGVDVMKFSVGC